VDTLTQHEFQALFDVMPDGIVITCAASEVILVLHSASQGLYAERVRAAQAGEPGYRVALLNRQKDGSALILDVRAQDFVFRGRPARMAVVREMTEQVQAFELLEERVAVRTRELSTLLEISRAVTSTLDLRSLLGRVLDQLQTVVQSRNAWIMLIEGDDLCIAEYRGDLQPELLVGKRFSIERALIFQAVVREGGPVVVDDLQGQSPLAHAYRTASPLPPEADPVVGVQRSVLAVPLKVKDRIIGQVRLDHDRPDFYTQRHADLVLAVAGQAAIAIENARLFEEAERRRRELEALYGAEGALHRSLRREDVLEALVDIVAELLGSDKTTVLMWNEHHEALVLGAARGFSSASLAQMRIGPGEGLSWQVATSGQPIAVEDVAADARVAHHIPDAEGLRSVLHVPIIIGAEVVGVFGVNYLQPPPLHRSRRAAAGGARPARRSSAGECQSL
jgi:GAF domain-containing protein